MYGNCHMPGSPDYIKYIINHVRICNRKLLFPQPFFGHFFDKLAGSPGFNLAASVKNDWLLTDSNNFHRSS
jgi:hypothetical protein